MTFATDKAQGKRPCCNDEDKQKALISNATPEILLHSQYFFWRQGTLAITNSKKGDEWGCWAVAEHNRCLT